MLNFIKKVLNILYQTNLIYNLIVNCFNLFFLEKSGKGNEL